MDSTITVAELLDQWLEWRRQDGYAITSLETAKNAIRILKSDFGDISADAVKARHIEQWYMQRNGHGYASGYSKRVIGVMSAAYSLGVRWELVDSNPCMAARGPSQTTDKVTAPSPETVKALLQRALWTDPLLHRFILLAVISGGRRSELVALTRSEFDADMGLITIRRVAVPVQGGIAIVERTKSVNGARVVSIDADTAAVLSKSLTEHDSPWIFPGKDGNPVHPSTITHRLGKLGTKMGIHVHPHMLRHYSATQSLKAGVPIVTVAARLGDSVATIQRVYAHAVGGADGGAASALAASIA